MIQFLFLDLDDTILDFHMAERIAIEKTFRTMGLDPDPETVERYKQINILHWQMLERGEITREQVKILRFAQLFRELGIACDPAAVTKEYEKHLAVGHYFLPGAEEALPVLAADYKLYIASNGTKSVQQPRLESSGIEKYFEDIFISEDMGADKPSKIFFDRCFARIPGFDPQKAMIVGDSLTSDIQGGINAGIKTCWVNPKHKPAGDTEPDYEIEFLSQLPALL